MSEPVENTQSSHSPPRKRGGNGGVLRKPVSELALSVGMLCLVLAVSAGAIWLVKAISERHLDTDILPQTVNKAMGILRDAESPVEAENVLLATAELRPQLVSREAWRMIDFLPVLPRFADKIADSQHNATRTGAGNALMPGILAMELAWRFGYGANALQDFFPYDDVESDAKTGPSLEYTRIMAADHELLDVMGRLSAVASPGTAGSGRPPFAETSMVHMGTAWGLLHEFKEKAAQHGDTADGLYCAGVVAFYECRLDDARHSLELSWEKEPGLADTAYLIGAVHEINGKPNLALAWYDKAIETGRPHLSAAHGIVRLSAVEQ